MQDLSSGEMRDLTPFLKDMPTLPASDIERRLQEHGAALQAAKDAVQPDRSKQGAVFWVGEEIVIKGARFQITRIEPGHMRLKSLPAK